MRSKEVSPVRNQKRSTLQAEDFRGQREDLLAHKDSKRFGLQQYFTPPKLAELLARRLPDDPAIVVDPTAGAGHMLRPYSSPYRLAFDIDAQALKRILKHEGMHKFNVDLPAFQPYLAAMNFRADCVAMNPPYGLRWQTPWGKIDAQEACLRMALNWHANGYMLMSINQWDRFKPKLQRKFEAIAQLRNVFPGTEVVVILGFFAAYRDIDPIQLGTFDLAQPDGYRLLEEKLAQWPALTYRHRDLTLDDEQRAEMVERARAAYQQYRREREDDAPFSIDVRGRNLSVKPTPYEKYRLMDALDEPDALSVLNLGRTNKSYLVANPKVRRLLQSEEVGRILTISPRAAAVLEEAAETVNTAELAPLRPLKPHQRLGYLDNLERVKCVQDDPARGFVAGVHYKIDVHTNVNTADFERAVTKQGEKQTIRFVRVTRGLEITISGNGAEYTVHENKEGLEYLEAHFELPEIQDVSQVDPRYEHNLKRLESMGLC